MRARTSPIGLAMNANDASAIADTPAPPYYAVIFSSVRTDGDNGYSEMAQKMATLAAAQPGYLGFESSREQVGITVSYWRDREAIVAWKKNLEHLAAQQSGKEHWYKSYRVRVALVEREYGSR